MRAMSSTTAHRGKYNTHMHVWPQLRLPAALGINTHTHNGREHFEARPSAFPHWQSVCVPAQTPHRSCVLIEAPPPRSGQGTAAAAAAAVSTGRADNVKRARDGRARVLFYQLLYVQKNR